MTVVCRILLVDHRRLPRAGLRAVLERDASLLVVGEVGSLGEAVNRAPALMPDVVVFDEADALTAPSAEAMASDLRQMGVRLLRLDAEGSTDRGGVGDMLLPLTATADELLASIHTLRQSRQNRAPPTASRPPASPVAEALTARERDVLRLLAEGHSSKQIAADLHIAVATVETHRRQISARLHLHSIAELTKYAIRTGLTSLA